MRLDLVEIKQLIGDFEKQGIKLRIEGENLRYKAPKGAMTPDVVTQLKAHKVDILSYLKQAQQTIKVIPEQADYALSPAQKRLWILAQMEEGNRAYNIPLHLSFRGNLNQEAFEKTIATLQKRHESFATRFINVAGEPRQIIDKQVCFKLQLIDLSAQQNANEQAKMAAEKALMAPFDLTVAPLFRLSLIKLSKTQHVMLFVMHHIISDGWSINVFMKEFALCYRAFAKHEAVSLTPLTMQYRDYAAWQNEVLNSASVSEHKDYWLNKLAGKVPVLDLPVDYPRPLFRSFAGKECLFLIGQPQKDQLDLFCGQQKVSLFMLLTAILNVLLHRYTGACDIIMGSPNAGRNFLELEKQIGFYLNTLILSNHCQADLAFDVFLQTVKQNALRAYDHQIYPFDRLIDDLELERDTSRSPLFDVMLILQNAAGDLDLSIENLDIEPLIPEVRFSKLDLTFNFKENKQSIDFSIEYNTDIFAKPRIQRMGQHVINLLDSVLQDATQPLFKLNLLGVAEKQNLLQGVNQTEQLFPPHQNWLTFFNQQVLAKSTKIAIICGADTLTYAQLDIQANQLAHYLLTHHHLKGQSLVAIGLTRSLSLLIALLAVAKAGAAYLPLDPTHPPERLSYILEDANACLLLTHSSLSWPDLTADIVLLDQIKQTVQKPSPQVPMHPDQLAYVIYTSGSTGNPKGVQITHAALANFLLAMQQKLTLDQDVLLAVTTLSFDIAALELYLPLISGAQLVLASASQCKDALLLLDCIEKYAVTVMQATPATWKMLLMAGSVGQLPKLCLCGGEALSEDLAQQLCAGTSQLWNLYGPTETTIWSSAEKISSLHPVSIGQPLANTEFYVLDAQGTLQPIGIPGELHIAGKGLARGYVNRPSLTAEKFIANPFSDDKSSRLYKTGDWVRWLDNAKLEHLGRLDEQIKLRGFRIELGEIEARLKQISAIKEAVVVLQTVQSGARLVAFLSTTKSITQVQILTILKSKLPDYMLPSLLIELAQLPLTPNGKIDKKSLTARHIDSALLDKTSFVAAQSENEMIMVQIWENLLAVKPIGIFDHFFRLGGHSLLATRLVHKIQQTFHCDFSLRYIFEAPTVSALTAKLNDALHHNMAIDVLADNEDRPLSYAQQRLWFIAQLDTNNNSYHMPLALKISGQLHVDALQKSITALSQRHESLRMYFPEIDGQATVNLHLHPEVIKFTDLSALDDTQQALTVKQMRNEDAIKPFDLQSDVLFRSHLLCLQETSHILLLNQHHIISDAWSINILITELSQLYTAFSQGEIPALPTLRVQYGDYAKWQRKWLKQARLHQQEQFWQQQLAGVPTQLTIPTDFKRPSIMTQAGVRLAFQWPASLSRALRQLSQAQEVTLFMTLLATFSLLLSRYSGQKDIVIGSPVANRHHADSQNMVGFFVNTLAFRVQYETIDNFIELLAHTRKIALDAYAHQDIPFEKIVEVVQPERSLGHTPIFQVLLSLQHGNEEALTLSDTKIEILEQGVCAAKYDLTLLVDDNPDRLQGSLEYNTDLFNKETMSRFMDNLLSLLTALVKNPTQSFAELTYLSTYEQRLLAQWNRSQVTFKTLPETLVTRFEAQVARYPESIALVFDKQQFSYQQLNQQANQLAHYLRAQGIEQSSLVAVGVARSPLMIVAILAILKRGAAYVPLDPSYPQQRLAYLLADSRVAFIVTHSSLKWPKSAAKSICLDTLEECLNRYPESNPNYAIAIDATAYVMYTSGSTGNPKGVMVSHANVSRLFLASLDYCELNEKDVWSLFHSCAFDFSVWEIWGALLHGGRLVIVSTEQTRSPELFFKLLCQEQVTILSQTPSEFRQWMPIEEKYSESSPLTSLRYLIFGGEALDFSTLNRWFERHGDQCPQLVNQYGPTETTCYVTYRQLKQSDAKLSSSIIGRPLVDMQMHVLDEYRQQTPIGVIGELYVSGAGVTKGYLNRAALNAAQFIQEQGQRWYRTGDLVRYLADGHLAYCGRADQQVKIRGFRIELGEIEGQLLSQEKITHAVVVMQTVEDDKRLAAFYCIDQATTLDKEELKTALQKNLPAYMLPSVYIPLDALPLTSNGKIDRQQLVDYSVSEKELRGSAHEAAKTPIEVQLVAIWQALLGLKDIGRQDHFFDMGGHSLKAVVLLSKIHQQLETQLTLQDIFQYPVLSVLAAKIEESENANVVAIESVAEAEHYLASHAQRRLWLLEQMGMAQSAYNMVQFYELKGTLDAPQLEKAIHRLQQRHEILRSTFIGIDDNAFQVVHPQCDIKLSVVDVQEDKGLLALAQKASEHPFNLQKGPLFAITLYRLTLDHYYLLLNIHHIISDGWSIEILIEELLAFYQNNPVLPNLSIQYKDYSAWQQQILSTDQSHARYWHQQFATEIPSSTLNYDFPRPTVQSFVGDYYAFELSTEQTQSLKDLAKSQQASLFNAIVSLVKIVLFRYTGQQDLVIGTAVAGREHPDLMAQMGFYVNMLGLRDRLSSDDHFLEVLSRVTATINDAFLHQVYPFDRLVDDLSIVRDMGRNPLFDVVINMLQKVKLPTKENADLAISEVNLHSKISKFDLTFNCEEKAQGGCSITIEYRTDLFQKQRIKRMAYHFTTVLTSVLNAPEKMIGTLTLLPEWEKNTLLYDFNQTHATYPSHKSISEVFYEQVLATPNKQAVCYQKVGLTYQQLNEKANALAVFINKHYPLERETCIGVLLEHSLYTAVALLAILKAGAVYLPLDANYPQSRLDYMIDNTQCKIILTKQKYIARNWPKSIAVIDIENLKMASSDKNLSGPADTLAYIVYTSGSTGQPKGVLIEQRAVLRLVYNTNYLTISDTDSILQTGSLAFDASTFEIWGALLNGACCYFPEENSLLEVDKLKQQIVENKITILWLTTSLFNQLLDADISLFQSLNTLLVGGEILSIAHMQRLKTAYPELITINCYGPTENTTFTTCYTIPKQIEGEVPLGRPISNTQVYVLDKQAQVSPIGVIGEIYTGGDGVARGYLQQDKLTAENFIPLPWMTDLRVYRTGDLGYWSATGELYYSGRCDEQLKIRGFRIEPGEIATVLSTHPDLSDVCILAKTSQVKTKELWAYVASDKVISARALRNYLAPLLADYMIPSFFICLSQLPLTNNGKIDRKALVNLELDEHNSESDNEISVTNTTEKILQHIWQAILARKKIGRMDNYFELGGDSIKAIQIASRLRGAGWKMEVKDLFHNPSIQSLAPHLVSLEAIDAIAQIPVSGDVCLTAIQSWFLRRFEGDIQHFNQAVLLTSHERLEQKQCQQALTTLLLHHDALRITFSLDPLVQTNHQSQQVDFRVSNLKGKTNPLKAMQFDIDETHRCFDLSKSLLKAVLYQLDDTDRLLIIIHHLVVDGVSWRILLEDLASAYQQIPLPEKTLSWQQWAEAIHQYSTSESLAKEVDYWSALVTTIATRKIKTETETETETETHHYYYHDSDSMACQLSITETHDLLTHGHAAYFTEINDLLLTALARSLKQWQKTTIEAVMLEGHGRETCAQSLDINRTVGWFTSYYPFLCVFTTDNLAEQIKQIKESLRSIPNKGFAFAILQEMATFFEYQKLADDAIPFSFNYLGEFTDSETALFTFASESSGTMISPNLIRPYDLDMTAIVSGNQLRISLMYNKSQYAATDIEALLSLFKKHLLTVITHCKEQTVSIKTPSDFTLARLSLLEYQNLLSLNGWSFDAIEDIYPLSPMQLGLLFESNLNEHNPSYVIQTCYHLSGKLDLCCFKRSWELLSQRYAILRTAFIYDNVAEPLQIVFYSRPLEITTLHLHERQLEDFLEQDLARSFNLQSESLIRIAVLTLPDQTIKMICSYHHIILDGWCLGLIYQDLMQIYEQLLKDKPLTLAPVPAYANYIVWITEQHQQQAIEYWQQYLVDYTHLTSLPKWITPPQNIKPQVQSVQFNLPNSTAIKALTKSQSVTLNTFMQAIWSILLSYYNDTKDVLFGSIVSGRPPSLKAAEKMVGLFINAIPVRVQLSNKATFADILAQIQNAALAGEDYHYLALSEIQQSIDFDLFDHMLIFENYPFSDSVEQQTEPAQLSLSLDKVHDITHYDFDITVTPGESLSVNFNFNTSLYHPEQINQCVAHFIHVVDKVLNNVNIPVTDLPILSQQELTQLAGFNATELEYSEEDNIIQVFEQQVALYPKQTALVFARGTLDYYQLNQYVNYLAKQLQRLNQSHEQRIAICMDRCPEMIIAVLAVWKVGGAYIPLDKNYPEDRLNYILEDANVSLLLTQYPLSYDGTQIHFSADWLAQIDIEHDVYDNPNVPIKNNDLAYIIYTSGSTGKAKGVMLEHRGISNMIVACRQVYHLEQFEVRLLQMASFSFDVFVGDLIRAFANHGRLVICPFETLLDVKALYGLIEKQKINILESTPAIILPLMETIHNDNLDISFMNVLIISSDILAANQYAKLVSQFGSTLRIVNSYGVTEATIDSTFFDGQIENHNGLASTPIGRPIANTQCHVLDNQGRCLPIGIFGELHISGAGIARGYLNNPGLSKLQFIAAPAELGLTEKARCYKTGDRVRWLIDGNLEFMQRIDTQIKIRGYRIELGEIESQLMDYPELEKVVVTVAKEVLQAYFIATVDALDKQALRQFLQTALPDAMIPTYFIQLSEFPLTNNGKVDRNALPAPTDNDRVTTNQHQSPSNLIEKELLSIWQNLLSIQKIGVLDNFFALGGHSLKVMQLVTEIKRRFNKDLPLKTAFLTPTIAALAEKIATLEVSKQAIQKAPYKENYALSHAQHRIWILHHLNEKAATAYNMPSAYLFKSAVDEMAMGQAFCALFERHEALRTAFIVQAGEARQCIQKHTDFELTFVDISEEHNPELLAKHCLDEAINTVFDLAKPPLLHAKLFKIAEQRYVLILNIHHIVGDGWSMNIIYDEILHFYHAIKENKCSTLAPLTIQYKDFSEWQNNEAFAREEKYWLNHLQEMPPLLNLPYDFAMTEERDFSGGVESITLRPELANALRQYALGKKTTLSNVILALYELLMYQITKQQDFCIGMSLANRDHLGSDVLIGFFVNILPIRCHFSEAMEFTEVLTKVSENALSAFDCQNYPLDLLVQKINPQRVSNRQPLINVVYSFLNFDNPTKNKQNADDDLQITDFIESKLPSSKFDLTLFVSDYGDALEFDLEFDTGLFKPATVRHYLALLEHFSGLIVKDIKDKT